MVKDWDIMNAGLSPFTALLMFGALALIGAIGYGAWRYAQQRRSKLLAQLAAFAARDADELDLDKRLGRKFFVQIEHRPISIPENAPLSIRIAVRQTGHGPDILCVHGIGASMIIYRRLVPWLAESYRVTCIDLPGFGASDKPKDLTYSLDEQAANLLRIIEALDLKNPLLVASSMGGAITLRAALLEPDARGIVALAPAVDPRRIPTVLLPLTQYGDRLHRLNTSAVIRAVVQQVIARRELITPALLALYQEPFRDKGDSSSSFMKAFGLLGDRRMPLLFKDVRAPLLIVRGLRDRLVKQAACEDLKRLIPHAQILTHPTAGHHIMEDEPEFLAKEIRTFDRSL
jgi:pimeloyl-ACP methyl ester carboxylesterase